MSVANFLHVLDDGALVIVPGDRADVLVACLASSFSPEFPVPSALILTGGLAPDPTIYSLLAQAPFPIFAAPDDTYVTAKRVSEVRSEIWSGHRRKVASALGLWARRVDEAELLERLHLPRLERMTPLRFLHDLIERARAERRHIVLPEGTDVRILRAAEILHRRDVCELTVLGRESDVRELASTQGIDLSGINIIDPATSELRQEFAEKYAELRAHKGVDLAKALEVMLDGSYFGTMMVQLGVVDGMVSGAAHTTAHTIRPALEFVKTRDGVKIVSSVFLMLMPDRVLVYGDCAVNPEPNVEQLADIAVASAETAAQFGVEPRVAMLSYSTGGSGAGEAVNAVRQATELVRERRPDLAVEGPIQYDAAVDAAIAESKIAGLVRGRAGDRFHLPGPQHRQQHLQGGPAVLRGGRRRAGAAGPAQAGQRPLPRLHRGGHREHGGHHGHPGAVRGAGRRAGPRGRACLVSVFRLRQAVGIFLLGGLVGQARRREVQVLQVLRGLGGFPGLGGLEVPGVVQRRIRAFDAGGVRLAGPAGRLRVRRLRVPLVRCRQAGSRRQSWKSLRELSSSVRRL